MKPLSVECLPLFMHNKLSTGAVNTGFWRKVSIVIVLVLFYGTISCETTYPNQILDHSTGLESWTAQATTCTEASVAVAATQKIDELGNIGDDRSFLSLKVIFLRVATLTGSVTLFVSNHPRQSDSHYLSLRCFPNSNRAPPDDIVTTGLSDKYKRKGEHVCVNHYQLLGKSACTKPKRLEKTPKILENLKIRWRLRSFK